MSLLGLTFLIDGGEKMARVKVPTITVQQYDNGIDLFFYISKDQIVEPINGAEVLLKYGNKLTGEEVIRTCEITDPEVGEAKYTLTKEDTKTIGEYFVEIQITYENGVRLSVDDPFAIVITEERIADSRSGVGLRSR